MSRDKILAEEALLEARARLRGSRVGLTNGCFDLLHVGHVRYLQEARSEVDALIVAVNSDASVRALKGPARPIVTEWQRAEVLAALECVDLVTIFEDRTAERLVGVVRPDVYFKGADYSLDAKVLPEATVVQSYGGEVRLVALEPGVSTTDLIQRMQGGKGPVS